MEDASKAIWLAIGAILFIAGLTTAIMMYNNMINTINTTLSINDTKINVVEIKGNANEIVYTGAEAYFLLEGLRENSDKVCTSTCSIPYSTGGDCRIRYTYQYNDSGNPNDLNNHKISNVNRY